ncbi:unnamed protein product [Ambrosiozyma monospora]|uniref:Unnamed protein product n=1 Tax=Ambrosiozyma monospora TaxID=43982 RepID=A0A9W6Z066_AMBMO|nr:unnamed protein product [Ambrosiozyma monospora]
MSSTVPPHTATLPPDIEQAPEFQHPHPEHELQETEAQLEEEKTAKYYLKIDDQFLIITQLLFWAVLGNLARIGLTLLTNYEYAYINYILGTCLWSNFASCLIIATVNKMDKFWEVVLNTSPNGNDKKKSALYLGLTTGFCGSFSTFSSFVLEVMLKTCDLILPHYYNDEQWFDHRGDGAKDFFSVLFIQVGVSMFGWCIGCDLAKLIDWLVGKYGALSYGSWRIFVQITSFLGIGALIANLVLSITLDEYHWYKNKFSIAICFSPFGVILRYYLSKLNGWKCWFPTGTFLANLTSCAVLCPMVILIYGVKGTDSDSDNIVNSQKRIMVMHAIITGFCGTLSTMSTVINELMGQTAPRRWIYFLTTFIICFCLLLVIIGSYSLAKYFYMESENSYFNY